MHCNLILDISFLPIESAERDVPQTEDSFDDSEVESREGDLTDSLEEEERVEDGAEDTTGHQSCEDADTEGDQSVAPGTESVVDESGVQSCPRVAVQAVDEEQDREGQPLAQADAPDVVRTRAGRVVKKVNRLVETMVQQPFSTRVYADSQCLPALF